jgi:hypothetical protein|tara:strand:- start:112 stop:327 length:216 start_codon:yes stop_codon:yes gene_type:complete
MQFIPGTKFINNTRKHTKLFKSGVLYVLNHIEKNKDGSIKYVFRLPQTRETKEVNFESIEQADNFLSIIKI